MNLSIAQDKIVIKLCVRLALEQLWEVFSEYSEVGMDHELRSILIKELNRSI